MRRLSVFLVLPLLVLAGPGLSQSLPLLISTES